MLGEIKTDARLHSVKGDVPLPLLLSVGLFESDKVVEEQAQEAPNTPITSTPTNTRSRACTP